MAGVVHDTRPKTQNGKNLLLLLQNNGWKMETVIKPNLCSLTRNTRDISQFSLKLLTIDLLSPNEYNEIEKLPTTELQQLYKIYRNVQRTENWGKLIYAWEESNGHIIEGLISYVENAGSILNNNQPDQKDTNIPDLLGRNSNDTSTSQNEEQTANNIEATIAEQTPLITPTEEAANNVSCIEVGRPEDIAALESHSNGIKEDVEPANAKSTKAKKFNGRKKLKITVCGGEYTIIGVLLFVITVLAFVIAILIILYTHKPLWELFLPDHQGNTISTQSKSYVKVEQLTSTSPAWELKSSEDKKTLGSISNSAFIANTAQSQTTTVELSITGRASNQSIVSHSREINIKKQLETSIDTPDLEHTTTVTDTTPIIEWIPLDRMTKVVVEEPSNFLQLPNSLGKLYLLISPKKFLIWENVTVVNPHNVRAVGFSGPIAPKSTYDIIVKFKQFVTLLILVFEPSLCVEFSDYNSSTNNSQIQILLHEIHFIGENNCGKVFNFVVNHLSLENIRLLKFDGVDITYSSLNFTREIFQLSQNTVEYIYLIEVSICSKCLLFNNNLYFPNLKYAVVNLKLGLNERENEDTINSFNSLVPNRCRSSHNKSEKSSILIVKC